MRRLSLSASVLPLLISGLITSSAPVASAQSPSLSPSAQSALVEGAQFEQRRQLTSALDSDRRALKLAGGDCQECYQAIVRLQMRMELPKDAAATAHTWAAHASDPKEKSRAEFLEGDSLMAFYNQKHKDALLHRADEALRQASIDNPTDPAVHLLHGRVLSAMNRDADAKAEFSICASLQRGTPVQRFRAENFARNPGLARGEEAPDFTITGPDGSKVTLDSLAGKVVLIDFWATWCPPCNRDRDYIQSIAAEFQKDNFVLLGVSSDKSEATWHHYVNDNQMLGIQVRDSFDSNLGDLFHVGQIPTDIVLDGNGMVRFRVTGAKGDLRGQVRSVLIEDSSAPTQQAAPANHSAPAQ